MINTETKLIALLGYPLEHSFSTQMHNENFKKLGMNYYYLPIEVKSEGLADVLTGIKRMNFVGLNITKPDKVVVMDLLDEIDTLASKIGSVNTVKIINGKLIGYNTDGEGFVRSLELDKKIDCSKNTFFILGAGGACRAIAMTLASRNAEKIYIANRTFASAEILSKEINEKVNDCCEPLELNSEKAIQCLNNSAILINTTSLGMLPDIDSCAIDLNLLRKELIVADIVYNPVKTKLLSAAEEKGCIIHTGIGMFVNQGAKAFEIWTGIDAPVNEMKAIVEKIIVERKQVIR